MLTDINPAFTINKPIERLMRFAVVGVLGTLVDFVVFALTFQVLGVPMVLANVFSYSCGILNNYILHQRWTYADRPRNAVSLQAAQFILVSLSALLLNTALIFWLSPLVAQLIAETYANLTAKVVATVLVVGWNFVANNFWTFRPAKGISK